MGQIILLMKCSRVKNILSNLATCKQSLSIMYSGVLIGLKKTVKTARQVANGRLIFTLILLVSEKIGGNLLLIEFKFSGLPTCIENPVYHIFDQS